MLRERKQSQEPRPDVAAAAAEGDGLLRFDPSAVVGAIVFHLLDEGMADAVHAVSAAAALERLRQRGVRPHISRGLWAGMTNRQRLRWLLENSDTTLRLYDGPTVTAVLGCGAHG